MEPELNPILIAFSAVLPILIAVFKQSGLASKWNALIALVIYVIVGVAGALASGAPVTLEGIVPFIATVVVVGTTAYNLFWKHWGDDTVTEATTIDQFRSVGGANSNG